MASVNYDEGEVGFEEGMLWLPSHVLDEACGTKVFFSFHSTMKYLIEFDQMHGPGLFLFFCLVYFII